MKEVINVRKRTEAYEISARLIGKCDRKSLRLGDDKGRAWRSVQIQPLRSDENQLCNEFNALNSLATIR